MDTITLDTIARIYTPFGSKFGVPRQSGVVADIQGKIVFEPNYRNPDIIRGLDGFSHLWLIWHFSQAKTWSPTVRPPILGGNTRMGVFATRSPFRPNHLALSCLSIEKILPRTEEGPVILVRGCDMMNGTPIFDIKPYVPYADSYPDALTGFTKGGWTRNLAVDFPPELLAKVPSDILDALMGVLANDPRPTYQDDPDRIYGMPFGGFDVKFSVKDNVLKVIDLL